MPGKAWIIQQVNWRFTDEWFAPDGSEPLRAFMSRARAEAELQRMEQEARASILENEDECGFSTNLGITFGELEDMTSLSATELDRQVIELGLTPFPKYGPEGDIYTDYYNEAWWESAWRTLGKSRAASLWELFDRIRFYELVEVELPPRFLVRPRLALMEEMQKQEGTVYFPFESRADAEQFVAGNYPLHINPFVLAQEENDGNLIFWLKFSEYEIGEDEISIVLLAELESWVLTMGISGPQEIEDQAIPVESAGNNRPPPESEGSLRALMLLHPEGIRKWAGEMWRLWWDRCQPQMTDEQKRSLWHLLIPQSYEIIALEVEEADSHLCAQIGWESPES